MGNGKNQVQTRGPERGGSKMIESVEDPFRLQAIDRGAPEEAGRIPDLCELEEVLRDLFQRQILAVLSTQGQSGPWGSLVAFAATEDLRTLIFVTGRSTRKYSNLLANPHVAMVLDNRSNELADFEEAIAVTATGLAAEAKEADREQLLTTYLKKHPHLRDFSTSPSCSLFRVEVEKFSIVYRFQNVVEMVPVT